MIVSIILFLLFLNALAWVYAYLYSSIVPDRQQDCCNIRVAKRFVSDGRDK